MKLLNTPITPWSGAALATLLTLLQSSPNLSATPLPASYAMPAGTVITSGPGFRTRPYQTDPATDRRAGTIAWNEGQQAGLYGPNIADLTGADASGYYTVTNVVNWNINAGGVVDTFPPADAYPGIPGSTFTTVNFSEAIITYIEFPAAGTYLLGVNSDDGFGVTASALNPKDTSSAIRMGVYDGDRGSGDTLFSIEVAQPGIYPFRLLQFQGGGGGNVSWFSVVTNSTSTNYVLLNDLATPGALKTYAAATVAPPYANGFNSSPAGFSFLIQDDISTLVANTLQVQLNGTTVPVTTTKNGSITTITYTAPALLTSGSSNVVTAQFADNAAPAHNLTAQFSFIVPTFTTLPPSLALPASAVDTAQRGFAARSSQIDSAVSGILGENIAHAEAQLAGVLIDPTTGQPYTSNTTPGPQPDGSYVVTNINFTYDLTVEQGNFSTANNGYTDDEFPGVTWSGFGGNMAGDIVAYLDLQPGYYNFAVNCGDGFRLTVGANPKDAFGLGVGLFDYRAEGAHETQFGLAVTTAGLYPVRLVWFHMLDADNPNLEFYTIDAAGQRTLVNDASKPNAVKAYWKRTAGFGTYVKYAGPSSFVSPFGSSTDIGFTNASVVLSDGSTNQVNAATVVWTVDGVVVATNATAAGGLTKLTYNPPGLQLPRTVHTSSIAWTDAGVGGLRHTNSWNFHLLRNYLLPVSERVYFEDFESTAAGPDPTVPAGWTQVNFTGHQTPGNDPNDLSSDFYLGWVVVDVSFGITKDFGGGFLLPQILNGVALDDSANPLLSGHYVRAETDSRQNGPPGQIQYLYTKPFDLTGKSGIVIAFNSGYRQNQDNINGLEYSVDGVNYNPVFYWLDGDQTSDIYRDGLGNIDVMKTLTTSYGDVAQYTDPVTQQLVGGYYGFFLKAPITPALAPYIEARYNDDTKESNRIELYRVPLADNKGSVTFRFIQAGTSSWYWAIDNFGVYSVPSLAQTPPGKVSISRETSGQITISWTGGGTLSSAPSLSGPWTDVPNASNPMTITPTAGQAFYRLHQ